MAVLTGLLVTISSHACDICNLYAEIMPDDYKHSIGVYTRHRMLRGTRMGVFYKQPRGGFHQPLPGQGIPFYGEYNAAENYNVLELQGRFMFTDRISAIIGVPYAVSNSFVNGGLNARAAGLGDPYLLIGYQLLGTYYGDTTNLLNHRLTIRGGVKAPLGSTNTTWQGHDIDHDLQPGTGSTDFLMQLEYLVQYGKWGIGVVGNHKMNSVGADHYRYGNTTNGTLQLMYFADSGPMTVVPRAGIYAEHANRDHDRGEVFEWSGGSVLYAEAGLGFMSGVFSMGFSYQHALKNQWNYDQIPVINRVTFFSRVSF